jgi:phosphatidylserine/phosphatidylglycerophosphate/cardiolipin synthase-like enzyme
MTTKSLTTSKNKTNEEEPFHSHLKLTIFDHEIVILGSGNMDRASWYTSQELGILLHDRGFAGAVKSCVMQVMDGRFDLVYDSAQG